ncbi:hypothetical protein YC2023_072849 [Brassica napus]
MVENSGVSPLLLEFLDDLCVLILKLLHPDFSTSMSGIRTSMSEIRISDYDITSSHSNCKNCIQHIQESKWLVDSKYQRLEDLINIHRESTFHERFQPSKHLALYGQSKTLKNKIKFEQ